MENELYDYSPIISRPTLTFPDGKKIAVYVGLNIECFRIDMPFRGSFAPPPDPMQYGWRDYGNRVGIWRLIELFDDVGVRASGIINSDVCDAFPQVIEAGLTRGWAWVAHGSTNSVLHVGLDESEETAVLEDMFSVLEESLPERPRGWLGPGLTETWATPRLLSQAGFTYLLDWVCDDQPFRLNVPGMVSVPYGLDINDMNLHMQRSFTGPEYEQIVMDQFEVLLAEAQSSGRVMSLPIHTFLVGQPHRFKYFARVLRTLASIDEVWMCTSDEIADHFLGLSDQ
jgi:allantoinase